MGIFSTRKSTKQFISEAKNLHACKYNYTKVKYLNCMTKVCIICPEHGDFWMSPNAHLAGQGCPVCGRICASNKKRIKQEDVIEEARRVHGDKYDYSKVEYKRKDREICIICPQHGEFWQIPTSHLRGCGCPKCKCEVYKKEIFGFGINDLLHTRGKKFYDTWFQMLKRCYDTEFHKKNPTYAECSVCDEWKYLSNFKMWFDKNYVDGWHLDKDILVKGNKVYSPDTCCFVPQSINCCVNYKKKSEKKYPIGVFDAPSGLYCAIIRNNNKINFIGTFETIEQAFQAYKEAKESWIKELADKYKDELEPRVYEALYNWEI